MRRKMKQQEEMTMDNNGTDLSAEGSKQAHLIETGHHKTNFTWQTVFF